jgi:hypothetical protein
MGVRQDHPIIRRGINSGAAAREQIYAAPLGNLVLQVSNSRIGKLIVRYIHLVSKRSVDVLEGNTRAFPSPTPLKAWARAVLPIQNFLFL